MSLYPCIPQPEPPSSPCNFFIPLTPNHSDVIRQAMNFREEDVPVDIGVLPAAKKDQGQGQSLLVLTTRGYGKRVDMDEFKTTRR